MAEPASLSGAEVQRDKHHAGFGSGEFTAGNAGILHSFAIFRLLSLIEITLFKND